MRRLVTAAALVAALPAAAQPARWAFDGRGQPLAEALRRAAALTHVALSYDPALTAGRTCTCRLDDGTVDELLACVLGDAPLVLVATGPRAYTLRARRAAPPPPPETVRPVPPKPASVVGVVLDDATGLGVPDAVLSVEAFGTTTTMGGQFSLAGLPAGRYRLRASHLGYAPAETVVTLAAGTTKALRLVLRPRPQELPQVVVDGLSTVRPYERLGTEEAVAANASDDDERPVWPSTPADGLAAYRLQGLPEGDYLITLDGAPLFAPPSLLGEIGPLSPLAIGRVNVQKAGFGAASGSSLSGVVEATHALSPTPEFTARLTPLAADVRAMGALRPRSRALVALRAGLPDIGGLNRVTAATARRIAPDPLLRQLLGPDTLRAAPGWGSPSVSTSFTDAHLAYQHQGRGVSLLSASAYYGQRRLATAFAPPQDAPGTDTDTRAWTTYTTQAQWLTRLTGTTLGLLRASVAGADQAHAFRVVGAMGHTSFEEANTLLEANLDARLDASVSPDIRAEAGAGLSYTHAYLQAVTLSGETATYDAAQQRAALFGTLRLAPIPRLQAELGVRLTHLLPDGRTYTNPHLTLRADGPASPLGPWAVRLAGGFYHQFVVSALTPDLSPAAPFGTARTWLVPDTSTVLPAAEQYAAEGRVEPWPWLSVQAETFYRRQVRALTYAPPLTGSGALPLTAFTANTPLTSAGASVTVEVNTRTVTAQLRLTRLHERRAWPFLPTALGTPPKSQPRSGSFVVAVRPSKRVELTAALHAADGERWAYRLGYYAAAQAVRVAALAPERLAALAPLLDAHALNTPDALLPGTLRLDLSAGYQRRFGPVYAFGRLRVLNALGRANPDEWALVYTAHGGRAAERPTLPFTLGASLRLTLRAPEPPEP